MKICSYCTLLKDNAEFAFKNKLKEIRHSYCRDCSKVISRKTYLNNKEKINKRSSIAQRKRTQINRQFIWDYLKEHPCKNCGIDDPEVLEFNHINLNDKIANVSFLVKKSIKVLINEIKKCEILCANCHRKHTAQQFNYYKNIIK